MGQGDNKETEKENKMRTSRKQGKKQNEIQQERKNKLIKLHI